MPPNITPPPVRGPHASVLGTRFDFDCNTRYGHDKNGVHVTDNGPIDVDVCLEVSHDAGEREARSQIGVLLSRSNALFYTGRAIFTPSDIIVGSAANSSVSLKVQHHASTRASGRSAQPLIEGSGSQSHDDEGSMASKQARDTGQVNNEPSEHTTSADVLSKALPIDMNTQHPAVEEPPPATIGTYPRPLARLGQRAASTPIKTLATDMEPQYPAVEVSSFATTRPRPRPFLRLGQQPGSAPVETMSSEPSANNIGDLMQQPRSGPIGVMSTEISAGNIEGLVEELGSAPVETMSTGPSASNVGSLVEQFSESLMSSEPAEFWMTGNYDLDDGLYNYPDNDIFNDLYDQSHDHLHAGMDDGLHDGTGGDMGDGMDEAMDEEFVDDKSESGEQAAMSMSSVRRKSKRQGKSTSTSRRSALYNKRLRIRHRIKDNMHALKRGGVIKPYKFQGGCPPELQSYQYTIDLQLRLGFLITRSGRSGHGTFARDWAIRDDIVLLSNQLQSWIDYLKVSCTDAAQGREYGSISTARPISPVTLAK